MRKLLIATLMSAAALMTQVALASPDMVQIGFSCPKVTGNSERTLTNFGGRIAGYGLSSINSKPTVNYPYFASVYPGGANIPDKISSGSYASSGTDFNSVDGIVTCSYKSSADFSPFSVSYQLTNAQGGVIISKKDTTIVIGLFLGLHKFA